MLLSWNVFPGFVPFVGLNCIFRWGNCSWWVASVRQRAVILDKYRLTASWMNFPLILSSRAQCDLPLTCFPSFCPMISSPPTRLQCLSSFTAASGAQNSQNSHLFLHLSVILLHMYVFIHHLIHSFIFSFIYLQWITIGFYHSNNYSSWLACKGIHDKTDKINQIHKL